MAPPPAPARSQMADGLPYAARDDEGVIETAERRQREVDEDEGSDGRRLRAARNRESVVAAVLDIIKEQGGGPLPGAAEVADRAGVSERTVFRHFADLDSLLLAAARQQRPVVAAYLAPRPDMPELDRRIAAVVRLRARLYEEVGPIRRVGTSLARRHQSLARFIGEANKAARDQLAEVFQPELKRAGKDRGVVLDELDLATGWSSWEALRTQLGASPDRARRVVSELVSCVLSPYARRSSRSR